MTPLQAFFAAWVENKRNQLTVKAHRFHPFCVGVLWTCQSGKVISFSCRLENKNKIKYSSSVVYTAVWKKVVGKSARDNPDRYCGWFWVHCSSKKFERMAREAMHICLRVLKESNKSRFDSYSRQEQCNDHIPYCHSGLSRAHFFRQPFSK